MGYPHESRKSHRERAAVCQGYRERLASEYLHVEKPFLDQLATLGWTVIDHGCDQDEPLRLQHGRFCLRRDLVERGGVAEARAVFRAYYIQRGLERIGQRVAYYVPKVGVTPAAIDVRSLGNRWAS
ncbi:MAG: hypothetical protein ACYDBH_15845, partial [Acidobacteriaceae bacterium]